MTLAELFPDHDYRFSLRFERGKLQDYFAPTTANAEILAERRRWLSSAPETYAVLLPEGILLLEETIRLAHSWGALPQPDLVERATGLAWRSRGQAGVRPSSGAATPGRLSASHLSQAMQPPYDAAPEDGRTPRQLENSSLPSSHSGDQSREDSWAACLALGGSLEPDVVLLKTEDDGTFRLVAGVVCFPSHWSLHEKVGRPLEMIHGPVPGLNAALGSQISGFLNKLRPGVAWLRSNWGLTRGAERNNHPTRALPRLDASVRLEDVWVRLEHQALVALPQTGGVLFGIRLALHPLAEVKAEPALARGLARALQTMPEPMACYKGLSSAREAIIHLLQC